MSDTFRCAMCGGEFEKGQSDEEAAAEFHGIFGKSLAVEDAAVVCDDCFKRIDPKDNPAAVEQAVADELRPGPRPGWEAG